MTARKTIEGEVRKLRDQMILRGADVLAASGWWVLPLGENDDAAIEVTWNPKAKTPVYKVRLVVEVPNCRPGKPRKLYGELTEEEKVLYLAQLVRQWQGLAPPRPARVDRVTKRPAAVRRAKFA